MSTIDRLKAMINWGNFLIVSVLFVLLGLIWGIWIYTAHFTGELATRVDMMSVATTALLTLVLIGVYGKMALDNRKQTVQMNEQVSSMEDQLAETEKQTNSMEDQTVEMEKQADLQKDVAEVQKRQQQLMEAQHTPELVLQEKFEADEDTLVVELSNLGTGLAKRIKLDIEFLVSEEGNGKLVPIDDWNYSEVVEKGPMEGDIFVEGLEETNYPLYRSSEAETPSVDAGTVLPAGETDELRAAVDLWHYSGIEVPPGEGGPIPFSSAIQKLEERDVDVLAFRITLEYQNILDEEQEPQQLASGALRVQEKPSLQNLLDARHTTTITDRSSLPIGEDGLFASFNAPHY